MDQGLSKRGLAIGELAARCGVSVRALRLYEAAGLVAPLRTSAGRRVYGAADVGRLQQVLVLKRAGCTLARIGELLGRRSIEPVALLEAQIASIERQRDALEHSLGVLKTARNRLAEGETLDLDALCDLIRSGECSMTKEAWQTVYEKYYTSEDMANWEKAKAKFPDTDPSDYGETWHRLIARVEAAVADGVAPDAPRAMGLAKAWYDLQKPMVEAVGTATWAKAARMYQEMDQWRTATVKPPFSKAVYDFVTRAAEAARATGLIPPRVEPLEAG